MATNIVGLAGKTGTIVDVIRKENVVHYAVDVDEDSKWWFTDYRDQPSRIRIRYFGRNM